MLDKETGKVLSNQEFVFDDKIVFTDSLGHYEYKVLWSTLCPDNLSFIKRLFVSQNQNQKYIYGIYNSSTFSSAF